AESPIFFLILQERDDLLKFGLSLVHAGNVIECYASFALDIDLCLVLADIYQAAHALALREAAEYQHPEAEEDQYGQDPGQERGKPIAVRASGDLHSRGLECSRGVRINPRGNKNRLSVLGLLELSPHSRFSDRD